jgi:hypothetical protein
MDLGAERAWGWQFFCDAGPCPKAIWIWVKWNSRSTAFGTKTGPSVSADRCAAVRDRTDMLVMRANFLTLMTEPDHRVSQTKFGAAVQRTRRVRISPPEPSKALSTQKLPPTFLVRARISEDCAGVRGWTLASDIDLARPEARLCRSTIGSPTTLPAKRGRSTRKEEAGRGGMECRPACVCLWPIPSRDVPSGAW